MASSVPRARRKAQADVVAAKTLKAAFFVNITGYDELTATTYAALVSGGASEVSNVGTGYTTGGVALASVAAANLATNGARVSAAALTLASATFTFRYIVIYDVTSGSIEAVVDAGVNKTVTGGTITVTWDATYGFLSIN